QHLDPDPATGHHDRMHTLAQHRARLGDDRALDHVGVPGQHRLDLRGIDLQAAAVDHVLPAIEYANEIVSINRAEVAGMPEAGRKTLGCCLRIVPVALDDRAAMNPDFTDLAAR